ncbi:MAG: tetratricopeptide repeat protein [Gillisia sp.]
MKTNLLTIALSFLSVIAVAQKKEIRDAGKAIDDGNFSEAKNYLSQAEPNLAEVNDNYKSDFYLYKGQAYLGKGDNVSLEDLQTAADAFKKAQEMGSDKAAQGLSSVTNSLVQAAINDQNAQKYADAAKKLYAGYQMNTKDTIYLYYAASDAVNAKDYKTALDYYETLRDLGFTGVETQYVATNKETGKEEAMNKTQRDLMVKSGQYINPQDKKTEPKNGEIAKNIALIYIDQGENDKAIKAMEAAKAANPGDMALLQAEANMYYKMGKKDKYHELMENLVEKNPNDPTAFYNLGVTSFEMGDAESAIKYYKKALELDPSMTDARLNIAAAILSKEQGIVEQMNKLGMSKEDTKKYDELSEKRKGIYKDALPYLEKVMEADPNNVEAIRTTMNIYYQLGQNDKADALQEKLNAQQK